jgi:hypothetical protein
MSVIKKPDLSDPKLRAKLAKDAIEKAQANVAELAKINEKTAKESYQILNARYLYSLT